MTRRRRHETARFSVRSGQRSLPAIRAVCFAFRGPSALLAAARLPLVPAAARPAQQPGVIEPAPGQLAAIDDPAHTESPGMAGMVAAVLLKAEGQ